MTATSWHGHAAVAVAGEGVGAVAVPALGGKVVSLRSAWGEWLVQPPGGRPPAAPPGAFAPGWAWGWDDLAPTIDACALDGRALPDHGDLWDRAWEQEGATLRARGTTLPFTLERTVAPCPGGLAFRYALHAPEWAVPVLWAAHPVLRAGGGARVVLDPDAGDLLEVAGGAPGGGLEPAALARGTWRKVYAPAAARPAWAALVQADGSWLRFDWDGPAYLGVYLEHGICADEPLAVIEPCSGHYDALDRAVAAGEVLTVTPGAPARWTLRVRAGRGPLA